MKIKLEGCFMEMSSNTNDWMNIQLGISMATVQPLPQYDIVSSVSKVKNQQFKSGVANLRPIS